MEIFDGFSHHPFRLVHLVDLALARCVGVVVMPLVVLVVHHAVVVLVLVLFPVPVLVLVLVILLLLLLLRLLLVLLLLLSLVSPFCLSCSFPFFFFSCTSDRLIPDTNCIRL